MRPHPTDSARDPARTGGNGPSGPLPPRPEGPATAVRTPAPARRPTAPEAVTRSDRTETALPGGPVMAGSGRPGFPVRKKPGPKLRKVIQNAGRGAPRMDAKDGKDPKETERLRVGPAVRRRRRALDLTLASVAGRSGLSVPFLSQIENDRARPSTRSLQLVADALETTVDRLVAASDAARTVAVVRAEDTGPAPVPRARRVVRGRHQLEALEFSGEHDTQGEFQHRNDELMYVVDGTVEVEAEGRAHRLGRGDTLFLSGGVRHRWRATGHEARILVVTVADHIENPPDA
jgi:quercetin dioxygenase-like cupin family protein